MASDRSKLFSILMFPWIAHGHVLPYLQLAKNLSRANFRIHFYSTPIILDSIKNASSSSIQFLELHLPSFPDLPPHFHTTKNIPPALMPRLHEVFQLSRDCFSAVLADLKPDLLVYDVFQPWAATIAATLSIPAVHFATTGAAAYAFAYHRLTRSGSAFPYPRIRFNEHEIRKGLKRGTVNVSTVKGDDPTTASFSHFHHSCDIVLMKTSRGMEEKFMDYLSVLCKKKVVPVGPLIAESSAETGSETIMEWLGKKTQFSTVYISFGSENYLSKDQILEMARGLELCSVNFIWVLRSPVGESIAAEEVTPDGFLDRVKGRGMILTGFAPQAKILAHESVGAFVSHCGASSIIESLYFGVPVVALPLKLDQPLNARLVVEEGVGVEVEKDGEGNWKGENVAEAIKAAAVGRGGEELRLRAKEIGEKMRSEEGEEMNQAAEELLQICINHNQPSEKNKI